MEIASKYAQKKQIYKMLRDICIAFQFCLCAFGFHGPVTPQVEITRILTERSLSFIIHRMLGV